MTEEEITVGALLQCPLINGHQLVVATESDEWGLIETDCLWLITKDAFKETQIPAMTECQRSVKTGH